MTAERYLTTRELEASTGCCFKGKAQSILDRGYLEFREELRSLERPKVIVVQAEEIMILRSVEILERAIDDSRFGKKRLQPFKKTEQRLKLQIIPNEHVPPVARWLLLIPIVKHL
jgi:hypothetical protein